MSHTSAITTVIEPGAVIRFRQPVSKIVIHGTVTGFLRHRGEAWLTVSRRADTHQVAVRRNEIVNVVTNGRVRSEAEIANGRVTVVEPVVETPVVDVAPAPVVDAPVIVSSPARVIPPVIVWDAEIGDKVRYRSPFGVMKVGVVVEIDTTAALIEVGRPSTLELIDMGDIAAVLDAA